MPRIVNTVFLPGNAERLARRASDKHVHARSLDAAERSQQKLEEFSWIDVAGNRDAEPLRKDRPAEPVALALPAEFPAAGVEPELPTADAAEGGRIGQHVSNRIARP